ncbi:MAG: LamG domain-containing protein [Candidatus Dojkabacteria bacterium]|nr:MAG: LamG domain-containing protein [Candidatus Dojkabacteria bacterium]
MRLRRQALHKIFTTIPFVAFSILIIAFLLKKVDFSQWLILSTDDHVLGEDQLPEPIAYWALNEKSGLEATDSTLDAANGTLVNMLGTEWALGRIGNSLVFDGIDDYVTVSDAAKLNVDNAESFAISGWFKTNASVTSNALIIGKGGLNTSQPGYSVYLNASGQIACGISDNATFPKNIAISSDSFDDEEWHFFTCVKNANSTLQLYVNGLLRHSVAVTSASLTNSENLLIGSAFPGIIDEVKLYDIPLSSNDVANFYNQQASIMGLTSVVSNDGLVGYWKMDESAWTGAAGQVIDNSGTGNHGTSTGANTTTGKIDRAGSFAGNVNSNVNVGNKANLNFGTGNFTLSTWVYFDSTAPTNINTIMSKKVSGANAAGYALWINTWNTADRAVRFALANGSSGVEVTSGVAGIQDNTWTHIAAVRKEGALYLYVNGILKGTGTYAGSVSTTNPFYFGRHQNSYPFKGLIDDTRVYNRPLSHSEIITLAMNAPPSTEDLIAGTEMTISSPLIYWKFDEKSGATTINTGSMGASGNGTLNNFSNDLRVLGKIGSAIKFDGVDDYISTPDHASFTWGNQLTVSAWFKSGSISEAKSLVAKSGNTSQFEFHLSLETDGRVRCWISTNGTANVPLAFSASINYTDNQWHFASCVYNGSNLLVSVDGTRGTAVSRSGNIFNGTNSLTVGGDPGWTGNNWFFNGQIDNVKVWNTALTWRELMLEYNSGAPIAYWKLDEGSGTTALDYSGNGLHGTLTNMDPATDWLSGTSCKLNGCLDLDGTNDHISISNSNFFNFARTSDFSVSGWIKISGAQPTSNPWSQYTVIEKWNGAAGGYPFVIRYSSDSHSVLAARYDGTNNPMISGTTIIDDGKWHHVLFTKNSSVLSLYIDGVLNGTITDSTTGTTNNNSNLYFGLRAVQNFGPWKGNLDEIKIYNYGFNQSDVSKDYNLGAALRFE